MTLKIGMDDVFYGMIRNYGQFGIRADSAYNTKWTRMILGYFATLGQKLGCYVEYEWKAFDLTWFYTMEEYNTGEPWLHVEHENADTRIEDNLFTKIKTSPSANIIVIGYPSDKKQGERFIEKVKSLEKEKGTEIMVIFDASYYEARKVAMDAYIIKANNKVDHLTAEKRINEDGFFYGIYLQ